MNILTKLQKQSFFRNGNTNNRNRSELMVLVTPHIIREDGVPYFRQEWKERAAYHPLTYGNDDTSTALPGKNNYPLQQQPLTPYTSPVNTGQPRYAPVTQPSYSRSSGSAKTSSYIGTEAPSQLLPSYSQVLK